MTHEDAEGFLARNFNDRRKNAPVNFDSGLPLHEELKAAGFLEGEDVSNYIMHYGDTDNYHVVHNYATGDKDLMMCDVPHKGPVDCYECGWEGENAPSADRFGKHECPSCGEEL